MPKILITKVNGEEMQVECLGWNLSESILTMWTEGARKKTICNVGSVTEEGHEWCNRSSDTFEMNEGSK